MLLIGPIGLLHRRHRVVSRQVIDEVDESQLKLDWLFALKWGSSSRRFLEMRTHGKSPLHR